MTIPEAPLKPEEIKNLQVEVIPPAVFQAINKMLIDNLAYNTAYISQPKLRDLLVEAGYSVEEIQKHRWLSSFPRAYEKQGWKITFSRPAYNESGEAHWTFTAPA